MTPLLNNSNSFILIGMHPGITGVISSGLRGDISGLRGDISSLRGDISGLRGDISGLRGDISGLRGDISGLTGDATGITGNLDACKITKKDRRHGIDISSLVALRPTV